MRGSFKNLKKFYTVLMLLSFIFASVSPAFAAPAVYIGDIAGGGGATKQDIYVRGLDVYVAADPAKTIYFGNFWQSLKNGESSAPLNKNNYNYEGIQWRVLSNGDGRAFLRSDSVLWGQEFQFREKDVNPLSSNVWRDSALRYVMNNRNQTAFGTDGNVTAWGGFAGDAFSGREYAAIAETTHTAGGTFPNSGIETTEKIFALSAEEAQNNDYGLFLKGDSNYTAITDMASRSCMYSYNYGDLPDKPDVCLETQTPRRDSRSNLMMDGNFIWLRSPGEREPQRNAAVSGWTPRTNVYVGYAPDAAVCPAFNLNHETVLFATSAVGGKSDLEPAPYLEEWGYFHGSHGGDGFALQDDNGSKGWKLTLLDNNISTPKIDKILLTEPNYSVQKLAQMAVDGDKILNLISDHREKTVLYYQLYVEYSGVKTGKNRYVSALICNEDGTKICSYAKLTSAEEKDSGKVMIPLTIEKGKYTVKIFCEEENGDKQTDFASPFTKAYDFEIKAGTVNQTVLSSSYANSGLTANLGCTARLDFEAGAYDTNVNCTRSLAQLYGDSEKGTTLNGTTTVEGRAHLACSGKIAFAKLLLRGILRIKSGAVVTLLPSSLEIQRPVAALRSNALASDRTGSIVMEENGKLINETGEDVTVFDISGVAERVTVKDGYSYTASPEHDKTEKNGGSSGGCNAGFGALALLGVLGLFYRKEK